jgi:E3 ubiquitin-protein ligase RAD18
MAGPGNKDDLYDVSDPTDWLGTPLASLAPIDASLRCQVCKDFYKTPMITSCSHTFCSLCIRRCLANDGKCPACRTTEQENKLRSNWAIEGLVDDFIKARPALLSHSRKPPTVSEPVSPKRKLEEAELDGEWADEPRKKTRSSNRLSARSHERDNVVILDTGDEDDDDYQPGKLFPVQFQRDWLIGE